MRKATSAFWIRALVSSSVPPVLLIVLPRYVKQSVSSSGLPPTVTTFLLFVLAFITLVLLILMLSPVCPDTRFSRSILSCICTRLCDRRARSSAKSKSSSWLQMVHSIPFLLFLSSFSGPGHQQNPNRPTGSKGSTGFHFFCFCGRFLWPPGTRTVIEGTLVLLLSLLGTTQ